MGNNHDKILEADRFNGDFHTVMVIKENRNGEIAVSWNDGNPFRAAEILSKAYVAVLNYSIQKAQEAVVKKDERRIITP